MLRLARIGIFGGSFNPPHLGHVLAVKEFQKKLELDRVLVIPAAVPPHKILTSNSPGAMQRLELTRLAFADLPFVEVSDMELQREGTSYTADTVEQLSARYPGDELYLLMGTDMFLSLESWYQPERIAQRATIAVAYRDGDRKGLTACANALQEHLNAKIVLLENDFLPYSSTSVRAMLAFGCGADYIPAAVFDEICKNKLYYVGWDLKNLPFAELSKISLSLHKKQRIAHVVGCSQTARKLAQQYGVDEAAAERAGILHDITKALSAQEQLKLCENYAMILDKFERENPKLLHAKTGATIAKVLFGESEEIYRAIYWHTTGRSNMSTMEKIIYLADYMEPNRNFEGVEKLRTLTYQNLDEAMHYGLSMTIAQLRERGSSLDRNSLAALRFFEERMQAE